MFVVKNRMFMLRFFFTVLLSIILIKLNAQRDSATLSLARFYLSAATAGDKVLFAGGGTRGFQPSDVVDIYDVKTGQWETSRLSAPRHGTAAVSVGQKIYIAGGYHLKTKEESDVVDIYDVSDKTWTSARLSQARHNIAAVAVGNKILFAGGGVSVLGTNLGISSDVIDMYDVPAKTWSVQKLSIPRDWISSVTHAGKAYFAGGYGPDEKASARIDVYDSATDTWDTLSLPAARFALSAVSASGRLLFAGGQTETNEYMQRVDIWDPAKRAWSRAELSAPRVRIVAGALCDKVIFAGGGTLDWETRFINSASDVVDIYDLKTDTWSTDRLSFKGCTAAGIVCDNKFLTGGGWMPPSVFNAKVDIFTCQDLMKQ